MQLDHPEREEEEEPTANLAQPQKGISDVRFQPLPFIPSRVSLSLQLPGEHGSWLPPLGALCSATGLHEGRQLVCLPLQRELGPVLGAGRGWSSSWVT